MADDKSPLVRDIRISDAVICDKNEDILSQMDMTDIDMNVDTSVRPFDVFSLSFIKEEETIESMFIDEFISNSSFDLPHVVAASSIPSSSPSNCSDSQSTGISNYHYIVDSHDYSCLSISFSNPPGPIYHVRYLSEITNSPLDGNIVHTKKKTKKNISGRYLKGEQKRHVTINLPLNLFDYNEYYIRVTRLTVPYQNCSFIHPYPLLYSPPKRRTLSVITEEKEWIYFKLTKEDLCSHSKQFPNLILTRIKQSELKAMHTLQLYDDHLVTCRFEGDTPKKKIALYQLKKSQLDFRLVMRCPQTGGFIDLHASCRSRELLEEEGGAPIDGKKLVISLPL
ncbi:unnamed protein product [Adineta ricciae]|uniref:Uncharacterized protein n=1 Tax=Adineta ricciae TaxID=249248 RepID=A0A815W1Z7_ADIRI|nr:unnamed protein product [Adineta ricciae]